MSKPVPRLKQAAAANPVPQTLDEVNDAIAKIGAAQRERDRIEADMNDELAATKRRFEDQAAPHKDRIRALAAGVQTWCEAHRAELTQNGKVKYAALAAGEIKWRTRPPRCTIRAADTVLETLRRLGLTRFIRTREELNKEAMLTEPQAVEGIAGIKIEQGEDFVILPFETDLEQVVI